MLLKKYANRRLYDTASSRYVTLEEVAERIRAGEDAIVIDASDGADLTQATLTQIILESRGAAKLLPVPLLHQLIRLGDDALGEFFNRWISWALEFYVAGKQSVGWMGQWNPMLQGGPFSQGFGGFGGSPWGWPNMPWDSRGGQQTGAPMPTPMGPGVPQPPGYAQGPAGPPAPPQYASAPGQHAPANAPHPGPQPADEMSRLRRELEELRAGFKGRKRGPRKKNPGPEAV